MNNSTIDLLIGIGAFCTAAAGITLDKLKAGSYRFISIICILIICSYAGFAVYAGHLKDENNARDQTKAKNKSDADHQAELKSKDSVDKLRYDSLKYASDRLAQYIRDSARGVTNNYRVEEKEPYVGMCMSPDPNKYKPIRVFKLSDTKIKAVLDICCYNNGAARANFNVVLVVHENNDFQVIDGEPITVTSPDMTFGSDQVFIDSLHFTLNRPINGNTIYFLVYGTYYNSRGTRIHFSDFLEAVNFANNTRVAIRTDEEKIIRNQAAANIKEVAEYFKAKVSRH